ncbi:MAG TPA: YitT family protein [Bacilli bacterium]
MINVYRILIIFFSSVVIGFAFNMFLLPHEVLIGGLAGVAMMLGLFTPMNAGFWIILLNIPILVWGWLKLGRGFIINSIFSVTVTALSMQYIPIKEVTDDPLLSSVYGGVIAGAAIGLIIRNYGTTGGIDIIVLLLTRSRDLPVGGMIFIMNSIVVILCGFMFNWELALYTMASIYIVGILIDRIHTRHIKLSLLIVTSFGDQMRSEFLSKLIRGITVLNGVGAYSNEKRELLYTVITRYELAVIKPIIKKIDPNAFVSISETVEVMGNFRRD